MRKICGSVIFINNAGFWQPVGGASKIRFTFHFGHKFFILDDVKLAMLNERM